MIAAAWRGSRCAHRTTKWSTHSTAPCARSHLPPKMPASHSAHSVSFSITRKIYRMRRFASGFLVLATRRKHSIHEVDAMTMVEAIGEFVEIQRQILGADLVVLPDDGALEQRPHAFDAVGVNLLTNRPILHVQLGVFHAVVRELRRVNPVVARELIGVDVGAGLGVLANEGGQR